MICRMNGWCVSGEALPSDKREDSNNYTLILKKHDQKNVVPS